MPSTQSPQRTPRALLLVTSKKTNPNDYQLLGGAHSQPVIPPNLYICIIITMLMNIIAWGPRPGKTISCIILFTFIFSEHDYRIFIYLHANCSKQKSRIADMCNVTFVQFVSCFVVYFNSQVSDNDRQILLICPTPQLQINKQDNVFICCDLFVCHDQTQSLCAKFRRYFQFRQ